MHEVRENVPLSELTTFKIGGSARYFVDVRSEQELLESFEWASSHKVRHMIFAGGSNVLMPDAGIDALMVRIKGDLWGVSGEMVDTWAGTNLLLLIESMGKNGLGGWEKLAGIPGTIGGAVRGNAGAFGSELKDFVHIVRALNIKTKEIREFTNAECDFSYRHSYFKVTPEWVITRAIFKLHALDSVDSARLVQETIAEREKRHLQNVRAAGSYFMNPVAPEAVQKLFEEEKGMKARNGRVPAGWLIEKAGMKGARVGGAIASIQHPNYLVNENDASSKDVLELALKVKKAVLDKFGVELQEEAEVMQG